jgi:hydroxymethylpyrimidine/phosphomethylpyrimidine kinase
MFELSYLSQMEVSGIDSAIKASKIIQSNGPEWVLSTGIYSGETEIADILVTPNDVRIFSHKRQHTGVSGAGDTLTAILTSLLVSGEPLENAARKACTITQSLIGLSNSPQSMPPLTLDLLRK